MAPFATWNGDRNVWETPALAFCGHAAPFSDGWPESGVMRDGSADATPPATAEPPPGLLPTPTAWEQRSDPNVDPRNLLPLAVLRLGQPEPTDDDDDSAAALLPTPLTTDHKNNATPGALGRQSPQLGPVVAALACTVPDHDEPPTEPRHAVEPPTGTLDG